MREYFKPYIEDEVIEVEDIIAASPANPMSDPVESFDPTEPGDEIIL